MQRYCYLEEGSRFWEGWFVNAESDAEALRLIANRYSMYFGSDGYLPAGAMFEVTSDVSSIERSSSRYLFSYKKSIKLKNIINNSI